MNTIQNSISIDSQYKTVDSGATSQNSASVTSVAQVVASSANVDKNVNNSSPNTSTSSKTSTTSTSSSAQAQKAVDVLNKKLDQLNSDYMLFKKDKDTGLNVYELVDKKTHEVIKQYPSEEFLNMSKRLGEYLDRALASKDQGVGSVNNTSGSNLGNLISQSV